MIVFTGTPILPGIPCFTVRKMTEVLCFRKTRDLDGGVVDDEVERGTTIYSVVMEILRTWFGINVT